MSLTLTRPTTRPLWTAQDIATATGGTAHGDFVVTGVAFDSREVGDGDLFIAMRGETTDGNRFVAQAFASGAAGAIVEQPVDHPHVLVADATAALVALGRAARARSNAVIVGVTGSVGKTGTKEAIAAALERHAPGAVHRSVKSYNNHTGVPLSLARMPADARYGVFEMGMNHAGEIAELTRMVRPHVAVITTIAPAHIEHLGSMEAIADAKAEIFAGLEPGGTAIIPFDSPWCGRLAAAARASGAQVVTFGIGEGADVRARDWVPDDATGGSLITAELGDATLCFSLAQPGDHWVANAMAVLATVRAAGADLPAAGVALAELPGLAGRGARHRIAVGSGEALLIDESYNANPASMAATLAQLGREPATRRIAVLGAMRELGEQGDAFHAALLPHLQSARVDQAVLVGDEMQALADAMAASPVEKRIEFAHERAVDSALDRVQALLRPGDAILVKGSNSVGLSRIVAALTGGVKD
jgi:UDP-N-acetylmuramoyl-tripeptide--D-alanyl-D-alanine ligase